MSETGHKLKSSVSARDKDRPLLAGKRQMARRHFSADDDGAVGGSFDYDDTLGEDANETLRNQVRQRRLKTYQSTDSADTSQASSGSRSRPDATTSNSFKTIWKKAIRKLYVRRSRSTDDANLRSTSPDPNTDFFAPARSARTNGEQRFLAHSTSSRGHAEATGEVDPVYRFLKLTSVMPREGTSVIPGEDHYCCSKTDQDIGMVTDNAAAGNDPSQCQCPCHLPERLQSVHDAWIRSFAMKKT